MKIRAKFTVHADGEDMAETCDYIATIETDNDAFQDGNKDVEIRRIVIDAAGKIKANGGLPSGLVLRDINGNCVGTVKELL